MPPVIDREHHTTIYPDGTVVDEITETTWDDECKYILLLYFCLFLFYRYRRY